ncbi:MAG: response regulator transcription factor [Spirochaetes bacterium]|nr:response regulator transcription factor [Spirochaetota bacterium]
MNRVLIIEDDLQIAELERDYLALAGFDATIEVDGTRGLELALAGEWDVLVVDLMLPGTDGFEICRRVRESIERPVIVVSARTADGDKVRALGFGIDDYVQKPFSPAELVARIRAHHQRYVRLSGPASPGTTIAGRICVDPGRRVATRDGEPIALTATEYAILELLASAPGRVYSRDEIFSKVRGGDYYGDESTITVHIRRLREKIEDDPSDPHIVETVWGMGYRFRGH